MYSISHHPVSCHILMPLLPESLWTAATQEPEAVKPAEEEKKVEETNGKPDSKAEAT